jgi:hypothetical protein
VREFIRHRRWIHRGEAIVYGTNIACDAFSTDAAGYRHSTVRGETLGVADCVQRPRYGLVLGPSSVYGFGLAGNENTMPSLLAERFGFPFANIGLPEGTSRNLFSILLNLATRAPRPPAAVVHISGGDYTSFCYTGIADAVFGTPNLKQMEMAVKERGGRPNPASQIKSLLAFTTLWIGAVADLCRLRGIALVLADDTTFFEKREPSAADRECRLGIASSPVQKRQFDTHKRFDKAYHGARHAFAEQLGVPLVGPGLSNQIGFVDEVHYDAAGTRALCDDFAAGLEPLLSAAPKRGQAASRSTNSG